MVRDARFSRSRGQSFGGEIKPVALALGLAFGLSVGAVPAASAATITVNNLSGTSVVGQCTLRDAILAADTNAAVQGCAAGSGTDTINFSVSGSISLATQLVINSDMTITGPGAASLTLAASGTERILYVNDNNPAVTISGVTFQGNGTATSAGGAIYNYAGNLTIQNCVFSGNATTQRGGAVYNYGGNLLIQSSTFTGNSSGQSGGAVYNSHGNVTIQTSIFSTNSAGSRGGAIFMYSGTLSIATSTLSGNQSVSDGGAIAFYEDGGTTGTLTIANSTLSGNQTTGPNRDGGAIFMYRTLASTITNSTISGNTATGHGGGISLYSSAPLTINNSTLSGNTAGSSGGGVYLYNTTLNLISTIIGNSTDSGGTRDIFDQTGSTVNASNSLIQNGSGFTVNTGSANIIGQNPLLGPLANNGGTTQTHALLSGSPAIDTGSNPLALAFDQRGAGFARSSGPTDIGAFEIQGGPPPPPVTVVGIPTLSQ